MRIVYHWENGAFVNDCDEFFHSLYKELVEAFGPPPIAKVENDWDDGPKLCDFCLDKPDAKKYCTCGFGFSDLEGRM